MCDALKTKTRCATSQSSALSSIPRMKRTAAAPFKALDHKSRAIFSCSASASGAEVIMATPTRMFGYSPRRNGLNAKIFRSGWRKI